MIEWFRKQTLQTKISLVSVIGIAIIAVLITISNLVYSVQEEIIKSNPSNNPTVVPTPTQVPTSTPTLDPATDTGPAEKFYFPFGDAAFYSLFSTSEQAFSAYCNFPEGQTLNQKIEALSPYFIEPQAVAEMNELLQGQVKLSQECRDILVAPMGDADDKNKTMKVQISSTIFFIDISQKNTPPAERRTIRKFETKTYIMQLQSDSTWKVLSIV